MKTLIDISPERTGTAFRMFEVFPKIKDATVIRGMHLVQYKYIKPCPEFATPYEKLDLLKKKYPDACFLYVDRDRETWVVSLYNHWVRHGGTLSFETWYDNVMNKQIFITDRLIGYAEEIFGDNFYLMRFEDMVVNPNVEFNKMLSYFGLKPIVVNNNGHNSSLSDRQIGLNRFLNKVHNRYFVVRRLMNNLKS